MVISLRRLKLGKELINPRDVTSRELLLDHQLKETQLLETKITPYREVSRRKLQSSLAVPPIKKLAKLQAPVWLQKIRTIKQVRD
jgi:hypothetical protein